MLAMNIAQSTLFALFSLTVDSTIDVCIDFIVDIYVTTVLSRISVDLSVLGQCTSDWYCYSIYC